jgi:hypothetical protein
MVNKTICKEREQKSKQESIASSRGMKKTTRMDTYVIVNGRVDALVRYIGPRCIVLKGIVAAIGRGVTGKVGVSHLERQARLVFVFAGTATAAITALVEPSMR